MEFKMCQELKELQAKMKAASTRENTAEKNRVLANRKLALYYDKVLKNNPNYTKDLWPQTDQISITWGGEVECNGHKLTYYFKHMNECPAAIQATVEQLYKDQELQAIYKEKKAALKERAEARKDYHDLQVQNEKWFEDNFLKKFPQTMPYKCIKGSYSTVYKFKASTSTLSVRITNGKISSIDTEWHLGPYTPTQLLKSKEPDAGEAVKIITEWLN